MRAENLMSRISGLIQETPENSLAPCEDTARRWLSVNQEENSHQIANLLVS